MGLRTVNRGSGRGGRGKAAGELAILARRGLPAFDQDIDMDDEFIRVGDCRIGLIFLDEHVLGFKPLVVKVIGDRLAAGRQGNW